MTDPTPAPLSREQMALLETLQQGRAHRATEAFRHQGERDHHKKVADALAAALAALRAQAPPEGGLSELTPPAFTSVGGSTCETTTGQSVNGATAHAPSANALTAADNESAGAAGEAIGSATTRPTPCGENSRSAAPKPPADLVTLVEQMREADREWRRTKSVQAHSALLLAHARVLAAPPPEAPEPPADLVALVLEWQAAGKAVDEAGEGVTGEHWDRYYAAMDAVRYWTPAVSPVPPPAPVQHKPLSITELVQVNRLMDEWPADLADRVLARLTPAAPQDAAPAERDVLAAPCRWCGYNGEGYWQAGTHAITCPWRQVGGDTRRRVLDTLDAPTPKAQDAAPAPMPRIEFGDVLVTEDGRGTAYNPSLWQYDSKITAIERNGVVIWRREGKP